MPIHISRHSFIEFFVSYFLLNAIL
ncbi:hypothetical protein THIARS_60992 [Thiomonas delicata]|uniref:Uncharacterized protein n=1 Tax=Thiomonas delicata TaxID=364030 RepID=A0A238D4Y7_THIDL|nr:hypothetical protein THIARS_60992 [Thiomonas delicata]